MRATVAPKPPGERTEVALTIKDARLWWPGAPGAKVANLYTANVSLSIGDSRSVRFGVKQMTLEVNERLKSRLFSRWAALLTHATRSGLEDHDQRPAHVPAGVRR